MLDSYGELRVKEGDLNASWVDEADSRMSRPMTTRGRTARPLFSGITTTSPKALPIACATAGLSSSGTTPRTS